MHLSLRRRHAADDLPFQPLKDEPKVDLLGKVGAGLFQYLDALLGTVQGLGQAAGLQMQVAHPLVGEGRERPLLHTFLVAIQGPTGVSHFFVKYTQFVVN